MQNTNTNENEFLDSNNSEHLGYVTRNISVKNISFSIDEDVKQPKYYRNVIEEMKMLPPESTVDITICSYGGSLDGVIALIESIRSCKARVIANITGTCISAGSILALNCPNIIVSPYASMMIHTALYDAYGNVPDIKSYVDFNTKRINDILDSTYKGFLSDKELQQVKDGKELWFTSLEIEERLDRKMKYLQKLYKAKKKTVTA